MEPIQPRENSSHCLESELHDPRTRRLNARQLREQLISANETIRNLQQQLDWSRRTITWITRLHNEAIQTIQTLRQEITSLTEKIDQITELFLRLFLPPFHDLRSDTHS